jgi:hypothetical protein
VDQCRGKVIAGQAVPGSMPYAPQTAAKARGYSKSHFPEPVSLMAITVPCGQRFTSPEQAVRPRGTQRSISGTRNSVPCTSLDLDIPPSRSRVLVALAFMWAVLMVNLWAAVTLTKVNKDRDDRSGRRQRANRTA